MKREILFRGKRIDTGEWVEGDLINDYIPKNNEWSPYIMEVDSSNWDVCEHGHLVHPDTVGQFTGLLDKNGKKIFEGDLLVFTSDGLQDDYEDGLINSYRLPDGTFGDPPVEVAWCFDECMFYQKGVIEGYLNSRNKDNYYVIGTIHDNKEATP
jgi:uncharacterized phage protein (TIGR01671 family)